MPEVVGVRFHGMGKAYDFSLNGYKVAEGDAVIVETNKGLQLGFCADGGKHREENQLFGSLRPILRLADAQDRARYEQNREDEKDAFRICRDKIDEHRLDMFLVDVEYTLDRQKLIFYFTADERVDFRTIVRELAAIFRCRIELRQIGVRDEARMSGGIGICGREFCCSSWLSDFVPVSVKMAKTQELSMNPTKISGTCGRLMCCLKYEQDQYAETRRIAPKRGLVVETPRGRATVLNVDLLTEAVTVQLENGSEEEIYRYQIDELTYEKPARRKLDVSVKSASAKARDDAAAQADEELDEADSPVIFETDEVLAGPEESPHNCGGSCSCPKKTSLSDDTETVVAAGMAYQEEKNEKPASESRSRRRRIGRPAAPGFIPHPIVIDPAETEA